MEGGGEEQNPPVEDQEQPTVTEITAVKITSDINGDLKAGDSITNPTLTVEGDNATVTFGKWYKGDTEASGKFEEGNYTYTFTIAPNGENAKFADNLTVTLNGSAVTATETANVYKSPEFTVKKATTDDNTDAEKLAKAKADAKKAVDALKNLTPEEKEAEKGKIDAAKTVDDVTKAKDAAIAADKKAAEDKKTLDKQKEDAKAEVDKLANLSDDEKNEAKKAINAANDKAGVDSALTDARTKDANNKKAADDKKALDEAKDKAKKAVEDLKNLTPEEKKAAKKAIDDATDKAGVDKALEVAKAKNDAKKPETKEYTISKAYTNHGSFTVSKDKAKAGETITVAAKPDYGYAVDSIYYIDNNNVKHIIKNYSYNDHYYYNYNDRYYGDYYRYYSDYETIITMITQAMMLI